MNWVGGIRRRINVEQEKKRQKEFFERRKYEQKVKQCRERIGQNSSSRSQDLLAFQLVNRNILKPEKPKRPANIIKVDLDKSQSNVKNVLLDLPLSNSPVTALFSRSLIASNNSCSPNDKNTTHRENIEPNIDISDCPHIENMDEFTVTPSHSHSHRFSMPLSHNSQEPPPRYPSSFIPHNAAKRKYYSPMMEEFQKIPLDKYARQTSEHSGKQTRHIDYVKRKSINLYTRNEEKHTISKDMETNYEHMNQNVTPNIGVTRKEPILESGNKSFSSYSEMLDFRGPGSGLNIQHITDDSVYNRHYPLLSSQISDITPRTMLRPTHDPGSSSSWITPTSSPVSTVLDQAPPTTCISDVSGIATCNDTSMEDVTTSSPTSHSTHMEVTTPTMHSAGARNVSWINFMSGNDTKPLVKNPLPRYNENGQLPVDEISHKKIPFIGNTNKMVHDVCSQKLSVGKTNTYETIEGKSTCQATADYNSTNKLPELYKSSDCSTDNSCNAIHVAHSCHPLTLTNSISVEVQTDISSWNDKNFMIVPVNMSVKHVGCNTTLSGDDLCGVQPVQSELMVQSLQPELSSYSVISSSILTSDVDDEPLENDIIVSKTDKETNIFEDEYEAVTNGFHGDTEFHTATASIASDEQPQIYKQESSQACLLQIQSPHPGDVAICRPTIPTPTYLLQDTSPHKSSSMPYKQEYGAVDYLKSDFISRQLSYQEVPGEIVLDASENALSIGDTADHYEGLTNCTGADDDDTKEEVKSYRHDNSPGPVCTKDGNELGCNTVLRRDRDAVVPNQSRHLSCKRRMNKPTLSQIRTSFVVPLKSDKVKVKYNLRSQNTTGY